MVSVLTSISFLSLITHLFFGNVAQPPVSTVSSAACTGKRFLDEQSDQHVGICHCQNARSGAVYAAGEAACIHGDAECAKATSQNLTVGSLNSV
jgi:hypothetical protein